MNYKTYLFDFDYTLADSSRGIVKCFRIVLTRHQYLTVTDEAIKRTIGKTLEESFSILTGITDPVQLEAFRQEYRLEADVHMNVNTQLFPDTLSTLKELKKRGARIGIISTKYRFRILSFLEEYQPEDFLDIVVGVRYPQYEAGKMGDRPQGFHYEGGRHYICHKYQCRQRCQSCKTFTGRSQICLGTFEKYPERNFVYRRQHCRCGNCPECKSRFCRRTQRNDYR